MGLFGSKPSIALLRARHDLKGLAKALLRSRDPGIREQAAEALGSIGNADTVVWLAQALRDKDELVRGKAAEALGLVGDLRARAALEQAMADPDPGVREKAKNAFLRLEERTGK